MTVAMQPEDILAKMSCLAIETSMVLVFCMYEMIVCPGETEQFAVTAME